MPFQPPGFETIEDICNRALQHVGSETIGSITESNKRAVLLSTAYNKLRQSELRNNSWRFAIRRSPIRPISSTSKIWTPPAWSAATTYVVGYVVSYDLDGLGARYYISLVASNLANIPGATDAWDDYLGPVYADTYSATEDYFSGDLIYVTTVPYISLVNNNLNNTPAGSPTKWVAQGGSMVLAELLYPVGAGPVDQTNTSQVYPFPYGYLVDANQEPKAGAPKSLVYGDWRYEGNYIVTRETQAIVFRYVGDSFTVSQADPMFCEALAARIAMELCEGLTQSNEKLQLISQIYKKVLDDAVTVNKLETGVLPMGAGFAVPEDICNRALQHIGVDRIASFADNSKEAKEMQFSYDKLRQAELRRNVWRFATRRAVLYAITTTTRKWVAPAWAAITTYTQGQIVSFYDGYSTTLWISKQGTNLNKVPGQNADYWENYFGTISGDIFATGTPHYAGDMVYVAGSPNVFYFSLVNDNNDSPPSSNWATLGGTDQAINIPYPITYGPFRMDSPTSVYQLPYGWLRQAPQDPKAGSMSYIGAPSNLFYNDWIFENNCIVTRDIGPLMIRYVADIKDVTTMDSMFCEGLGCRLGMELAETLTPPPSPDAKFPTAGARNKIVNISAEYQKFMNEARNVNGIEVGAEQAPLDDYLQTRY